MAKSSLFESLSSVIGRAQADKNLSPEQVKLSLAFSFDQYRDKQTVLHFGTLEEELGPGHLVSYDLEKQTVEIQLRGDNRILEFTFDQINAFGPAKYYESPETMGEALIGAFWEAKITRKYLERIVANSYARLSPEEIDSFEKITDVGQTEIANLVPLELSEDEVKQHICEIIGHPFMQKDWGGETCDLFCNLCFRRRSVPAAFVLKGKSYSHRPLRIADLGKNGDQLVRLFSLPVEIFINPEQWANRRSRLQSGTSASCREAHDEPTRLLSCTRRIADGAVTPCIRQDLTTAYRISLVGCHRLGTVCLTGRAVACTESFRITNS